MNKDKSDNASDWIPIMVRSATREGICFICEKTIKVDDIIFYFPTIKESEFSKRGTVYCLDCFTRKVHVIAVAQTL